MKKLSTLDCMLKKCINLRKFIKFKMGKWSGFDLGKLYLFSHVNKGRNSGEDAWFWFCFKDCLSLQTCQSQMLKLCIVLLCKMGQNLPDAGCGGCEAASLAV